MISCPAYIAAERGKILRKKKIFWDLPFPPGIAALAHSGYCSLV
jgi:hypothetical protein